MSDQNIAARKKKEEKKQAIKMVGFISRDIVSQLPVVIEREEKPSHRL